MSSFFFGFSLENLYCITRVSSQTGEGKDVLAGETYLWEHEHRPLGQARQVTSRPQALLPVSGIGGSCQAPVAKHPALAEGCWGPRPPPAANWLRSVSWHITKHSINN